MMMNRTTTLKVIWHAPENTGPNITNYDVQYKKTTDSVFSNGPQDLSVQGRHYHGSGSQHFLPGAGAGVESRVD